jgi:hypothetical protein
MVQVNEQPIRVGNFGVGNVSIVGGAVKGEGGSLHPQLVVPLTIHMDPRPAESQIAITRLKASLAAGRNAFPSDLLCASVTEDLTSSFPVRSLSEAQTTSVNLRFRLTQAEAEHLESLRQSVAQNTFVLYVDLDATASGLITHNQMTPGKPQSESPWPFNYGMFSQVLPFWTCSIQTVDCQIDEATWIENVLPGLGYDRLRLLEVTFPPPLPDHTSAAKQFDKAKLALDQRRYGDCISECRGLLNMWEHEFKATKGHLVADVVRTDRGWPGGDIRRDLLDVLWKEIGDVANAPHHPEGNVNAELFDARDARLILLLTAALSEYVERR